MASSLRAAGVEPRLARLGQREQRRGALAARALSRRRCPRRSARPRAAPRRRRPRAACARSRAAAAPRGRGAPAPGARLVAAHRRRRSRPGSARARRARSPPAACCGASPTAGSRPSPASGRPSSPRRGRSACHSARHAVVVEAAGHGAEDRHLLGPPVEGGAVALHLLGDVAQRVGGAAAVELVDGDELGEVEHVDLLELAGGAELGRHHVHRHVDHRHDRRVALADARGLDDRPGRSPPPSPRRPRRAARR